MKYFDILGNSYQTKILHYLASNQSIVHTAKTISLGADVTKQRVYIYLKILEKNGFITRTDMVKGTRKVHVIKHELFDTILKVLK